LIVHKCLHWKTTQTQGLTMRKSMVRVVTMGIDTPHSTQPYSHSNATPIEKSIDAAWKGRRKEELTAVWEQQRENTKAMDDGKPFTALMLTQPLLPMLL